MKVYWLLGWFHTVNDDTESHLFLFLFVCWNNQVTAAATVPPKKDTKQPLNDIWYLAASLPYSLALIKIAPYSL